MKKVSALAIIDTAIMPVIVIIGSKILAIFLVTLFFNIPWTFTNQTGYGFFFINFNNISDAFFVGSISDLIMILTTAVGFLWILFRSNYFREDKIHPVLAAKLHKKGREGLITSSENAYRQSIVWLSLSWFTFLLILDDTLHLTTSQLTFGIAVVTTLGLTLTLLENSKTKR